MIQKQPFWIIQSANIKNKIPKDMTWKPSKTSFEITGTCWSQLNFQTVSRSCPFLYLFFAFWWFWTCFWLSKTNTFVPYLEQSTVQSTLLKKQKWIIIIIKHLPRPWSLLPPYVARHLWLGTISGFAKIPDPYSSTMAMSGAAALVGQATLKIDVATCNIFLHHSTTLCWGWQVKP